MNHSYRRVDLHSDRWSLHKVALASSPMQRLFGLHHRAFNAVLLRTRSIHTLTMRRSIGVAHVDGEGRVLTSESLNPMRYVTTGKTLWVLEVRDPAVLPPVRSMITVVPSSRHARNTCALCDADREPG
jgi:uncharacterized membrane protein (UPF0127 family)